MSQRTWLGDRLRVASGTTPVASAAPSDEFVPSETTTPAGDANVPPGLLRHDKLETAINWAAAGFTAVAALLTFFGIKDGTLDQALRLYPAATICIFILLGIGVVTALFARSVDPVASFRLWTLLAALLLMLLAAAVFFPDLTDRQEGTLPPEVAKESSFETAQAVGWALLAILTAVLGAWAVSRAGRYAGVRGWDRSRFRLAQWAVAFPFIVLTLAATARFGYLLLPRDIEPLSGRDLGIDGERAASAGLALAFVIALLASMLIAFVRMSMFSAMAGLTILAVSATSLGLYGATKITVESKTLTTLPTVDATVETTGESSHLAISVKAARLRDQRLIVEVLGSPRAAARKLPQDPGSAGEPDPSIIWSSVLQPDALDQIEKTVKISIVPRRWQQLEVRYCRELATDLVTKTCAPETAMTVAVIRGNSPESGIEQLNARIVPDASGTVKAIFSANDVNPGLLTRLQLVRMDVAGNYRSVAESTLMPDKNGDIAWEMAVPAGVAGTRLFLKHVSCPPSRECPEDWRDLATFAQD